MGCDIHLYFERRIKDKWQKIEIDERLLPDDRCYMLFAFLAGVRNYGYDYEPLFADRGTPLDTSCPKGAFGDGEGGIWMGEHSFTYAYIDEILNAPWEKADREPFFIGNDYFVIFCQHVLPRIVFNTDQFYGEQARNVRVIMGFDN